MKYINKGKAYSAVKEELKEGQEVVILKGFESEYGEDFVTEGEVYPLQEDVERYRQHGDVYCIDIHKPNASKEVPSNWDWLTLDSVLPVVPIEQANVAAVVKDFVYVGTLLEAGEVFPILYKDENLFSGNLTARINIGSNAPAFKINGATDYSDKFVYAYDSDLPVKEESFDWSKGDMGVITDVTASRLSFDKERSATSKFKVLETDEGTMLDLMVEFIPSGTLDWVSSKGVVKLENTEEEVDVESEEEEVKEDMTTIDLLENEVIYIAAPISTEAEVMYVNKLAETLRTIGYDVYSASEDEEINDKTNNPKAETIYTKDFDAIDDADIVLFVETGKKQVGSHIELGKVLEMRRKGIDVELIAFTNNFRLDKPQTQEGMASESINHLELGGILVEGTFVHGMTDGVIQHLIARKWGE